MRLGMGDELYPDFLFLEDSEPIMLEYGIFRFKVQ